MANVDLPLPIKDLLKFSQELGIAFHLRISKLARKIVLKFALSFPDMIASSKFSGSVTVKKSHDD